MFGALWLEVSLVLGVLGLLLYLYTKEKYSFFKKRNIPHLKPYFPMGNFWETLFFKDNFVTLNTKMYEKFPQARLAGMYQGLEPVYIVRDPEIVNRILIKDFSHFHDRGLQVDEETNPLEGHLFNMAGNKWKTLRNKLTPVFTSGKLKGMYQLIDDCVESFMEQLDKEVGKEYEIKDALCRLTTDVIGSCAFGIDSESIKDPDSEFRQMGKQIFNPGTISLIKQILRFIFPSLFLRMKFKTVPDNISDFFYNITKQNFSMRLSQGKTRNDFMQLLLELREKGEVSIDPIENKDDEDDAYLHQGDHQAPDDGKLVFSDNLLTAQAFIFFGAGFETSATSLSFTMFFLSKYPDAQEKLRQEIRECNEKHGNFTYAAVKSMKYLEACINESMRIYSPIGVLFRKCNKTLRIDDELVIEEGHPVFIPIQGLQMDPNYFPEPEIFKPERFITGSITPGTFIPFGDGPRICIAQRFALVELKLALAKIVNRYRIEFSPKMVEPLKLKPQAFFPTPVNGTLVKLNRL